MYAVLLSKMQSIRLWLIAVISVLPYTVGFSQSVYTMFNPLSMYSYACYSTHPIPHKSSLRGKVVDKDQNPVANIRITVAELDIHTYTDLQGNYAFCNFSEGKYTIIFDDGKRKKELSPLIMPKKLVYNMEW
jgi:hypothetical protein